MLCSLSEDAPPSLPLPLSLSLSLSFTLLLSLSLFYSLLNCYSLSLLLILKLLLSFTLLSSLTLSLSCSLTLLLSLPLSYYVQCCALHEAEEMTQTVKLFYGTAAGLSRAVPRGMQAIGRPTIPEGLYGSIGKKCGL